MSRADQPSTVARAYLVEFENAEYHYAKGDHKAAYKICLSLLLNLDLPLIVRGGCHNILATGDKNEKYHSDAVIATYKEMVAQEPENAMAQKLLERAEISGEDLERTLSAIERIREDEREDALEMEKVARRGEKRVKREQI